MKASAACLRKLVAALKTSADVSTSQNVAQLDDLADVSEELSPGYEGTSTRWRQSTTIHARDSDSQAPASDHSYTILSTQ